MIGEFRNKQYADVQRIVSITLASVAEDTLSPLKELFNEEGVIDDHLTENQQTLLQAKPFLEYAAQINMLACRQYFTEDTQPLISGIINQLSHINTLNDLDTVLKQIHMFSEQKF